MIALAKHIVNSAIALRDTREEARELVGKMASVHGEMLETHIGDILKGGLAMIVDLPPTSVSAVI